MYLATMYESNLILIISWGYVQQHLYLETLVFQWLFQCYRAIYENSKFSAYTVPLV